MRALLPALSFPLLLPLALGASGAAHARDGRGHILHKSSAVEELVCAEDKLDVVLNGNGNTITVQGRCAKVVVNGLGNRLVIVETGKLVVNGSDNSAQVEATDKIVLNGDKNKVTWRRSPGSPKGPKVTTVGAGNDVRKARP